MTRTCRVCGCTDDDCSGCIERTGNPCFWVERDLCSACTGKEYFLKACPACQSPDIRNIPSGTHQCCLECFAVWEPIPAGQPFLRDGELMPWTKPCDNCAFRQGSPERLDKDGWESLQFSLMQGSMFYCHKGVQLDCIVADPNDGRPQIKEDADFCYPKRPDGFHDTDRMRVCRGYLATIVTAKLREAAT